MRIRVQPTLQQLPLHERRCGAKAAGLKLDVINQAARIAVVDQAGKEFGGLSTLVDNVGLGRKLMPTYWLSPPTR